MDILNDRHSTETTRNNSASPYLADRLVGCDVIGGNLNLAVVVVSPLNARREIVEIVGDDCKIFKLLVGHDSRQAFRKELQHDIGLTVGIDVVADKVAHLIGSNAVNNAVINTNKIIAGSRFFTITQTVEAIGCKESEGLDIVKLNFVLTFGGLSDGINIRGGRITADRHESAVFGLITYIADFEGIDPGQSVFVDFIERLNVVQRPEITYFSVGFLGDFVDI